jgi:hypothetical protein
MCRWCLVSLAVMMARGRLQLKQEVAGKYVERDLPLQVDLEETSFEVCWWNFILAVCCLRVRKAIKMMDYFFNE